jgi:hypothetical protein
MEREKVRGGREKETERERRIGGERKTKSVSIT